jgi:hypothetical protein
MVINKNSTIKEILSSYPEAQKFFNEREMACSSCFAANFDTLEKGRPHAWFGGKHVG